ncbi:MAG: hypothetical protein Q9227_005891 [Pyrenula ochraceoflavens]
MAHSEKEPLLKHSSLLQDYYASLESRIGYRFILGGTRHFGYYSNANAFPLPLTTALRAMEAELFKALQCPKGSRVLDAGCGIGHVALNMAEAGNYTIEAIDIVAHHVAKAQRNIRKAGMESQITARLRNYHHLENYGDSTFDGVYTMETLVHSTDPLQVLREFLRILKPGGRIALHEYDHMDMDKAPKDLTISMQTINEYAAMPANASFDYDVLKDLMEEAGFVDVTLRDLSSHIVPMLWLFYIIAFVPYLIILMLGLEHRFVNTLTGVESYRGRYLWRYIQMTGRKRE